jgi:hypothetical protein
MRIRNNKVVKMWQEGKAARNHKFTLMSLALDDGTAELYSYHKKIGHRTASGVCVVADLTAPAGQFHSMTTSCHVNLAKRVANLVMHPRVWETCSFKDAELID